MRIGFFLATEEFTPGELLAQARAAEEAAFHGLWIGGPGDDFFGAYAKEVLRGVPG